jgi:hypothetical protein
MEPTHYNITEELISQIPFDEFYKTIISKEVHKEFYNHCGKEHYRLLAYVSSLFNNSTIFDIGTHQGLSAVSLAYNSTNTIHTFDIDKHDLQFVDNIDNIHFHSDNIFERDVFMKWAPTILTCPFIFIDIDPHNGEIENELINLLKEINYQGFVIWDDIYYFKEMRNNFWNKIPDNIKYDLTLLGHFSGTGITTFNPNITFNKNDTQNWTLVTAYFDLTQFDDATSDIKERNNAHYLSHARFTLSSPYNLIVYCEQKNLEALREMRPSYLQERTLYKVVEFDNLYFRKEHTQENKETDLNFSKYRELIKQNRLINKTTDNRNTPSYYLFCMSRYIMMKETIDNNIFNSTHFAWINICIERMGFSNLVHLDEALAVNRDKFSTCYIDYIPEHMVNNLREYFKWGRCSMCSGFFTGNSHYMWLVSDLIENQFIEYLHKGYGHADEQLYSPVYFKYPELFEHYYGDYQQMITNYKFIYEAPRSPIVNFIYNSFYSHNYIKCYEACKILWKSYCNNKCDLSQDEIHRVCYYYMMSEKNL